MGLLDMFKSKKNDVKPYKNSNRITISAEPEQPPKARPASEKEEEELIKLRDMILGCRTPKYDFEIAHKSQNYTTISYRGRDMARLAWTEPMHHVKIGIFDQEMYDKYAEDPMFRSQENKKELMWVTYFNDSDFTAYYPILLELFDRIDSANFDVTLTEREAAFVKKAAEALRSAVGPEGKLYVSKGSADIRLCHELSDVGIEFKPYKTKAWRLYCGNTDEEYRLLKSLKLYTGNKSEFRRVLEIGSPDELDAFTPVFKARYDTFLNKKYASLPEKEYLTYCTEVPY